MPLQIAAPEFTVYTDDLDDPVRTALEREVLRIRNSYGHALKVKDGAKIRQCVGGLRKIAERFEAWDCLQIAGRMVWILGDRALALYLFTQAADALCDSSSCFDLAMAQRQTGVPGYPATLRKGLHQEGPAQDPALLALVASVLVDRVGDAELAGLMLDAAAWQPGPARLDVLHSGLLCALPADLTGFPVTRWNAQDAPAEAFARVAAALHPEPAPAAVVRSHQAAPEPVSRPVPPPRPSTAPPRP